MKYAIILPDGCADEPIPALGNRTALEAAFLPNMDAIARQGIVGWSNNTPMNLPAGSDVATMCVLGFDPQQYYTGRAPLETVAMGIDLGPRDWAIRCNLVSIFDGKMRSFNAGQISSAEGAELLQAAQEKLGTDAISFYPGVSYRNIVVWRDAPSSPAPLRATTRSFAPHDFSGASILNAHPFGPGSVELADIMAETHKIFEDHPVNKKRVATDKLPATDIWLWGQGLRPNMPLFREQYGKTGAMITAVDLLRGLASVLGWERIDVPGATGFADTNYRGKGEAAVRALQSHDLVCVHIEAPDEAGHDGAPDTKKHALEQIDQHIVGPIHEALKSYGEYRILVTPDHPTPVRTKTHSHENVPWIACGTGLEPNSPLEYNESAAAQSDVHFEEGFRLMEFFLG
ncbi:MAG: cofactor-independent phosphoglycerate mutase [Planctomycetia bacterium]|nr:cofactor-independent phosphoglycerate mutase [Planctomycetia bacterium]